MSTPRTPDAQDEKTRETPHSEEEPGSNAVQHEPDPKAEPIPDGEHKHIPHSPYTTGNY
jgi:hypothetical protein